MDCCHNCIHFQNLLKVIPFKLTAELCRSNVVAVLMFKGNGANLVLTTVCQELLSSLLILNQNNSALYQQKEHVPA